MICYPSEVREQSSTTTLFYSDMEEEGSKHSPGMCNNLKLMIIEIGILKDIHIFLWNLFIYILFILFNFHIVFWKGISPYQGKNRGWRYPNSVNIDCGIIFCGLSKVNYNLFNFKHFFIYDKFRITESREVTIKLLTIKINEKVKWK